MSFLLKEIPAEERPRERLMKYGCGALATHELLAILLRTGSKDASAVDVAKALLMQFDSLDAFNEATVEELMKVKGVGQAKAIEILAAIEFGKRISVPIAPNETIISPLQSYRYLKERLQHETREILVCIFLNRQSQVIADKTITIGTLDHTIFNPRDILKWALKLSASGIIISHNHPSGNPDPSEEDLLVTKKLIQAAKLMDVMIVDHIIIGKHKYFSFLENRKL